jgi:hypothetical protein
MPRRTEEQQRAAQQAALYTSARHYAMQLAKEQLRPKAASLSTSRSES